MLFAILLTADAPVASRIAEKLRDIALVQEMEPLRAADFPTLAPYILAPLYAIPEPPHCERQPHARGPAPETRRPPQAPSGYG